MRSDLTVDSNPVFAAMKEYASRTRWAYSPTMIYPFHARLMVPLESVNSFDCVLPALEYLE
jgi:hypothetical protein